MRTWSIHEAKARFSELVNSSIETGPQIVTRHGKPAVVMLHVQDFLDMKAPQGSLKDFFLSAPRVDLKVERPGDPSREIDL